MSWVFCCGLMRSGSTLQYQLASELVERSGRGQRVPWTPAGEVPSLVEAHAGSAEQLVVKVHSTTEEIRREFLEGRAVGLFIYRDMRDAVASAIVKDGRDIVDVATFVKTQLRNYQSWTLLPNMLVSRYEDVILGLEREVQRIADHLGLELSPEELEAVASAHTIQRQRQRIEAAKEERRFTRLGRHKFDEVTLLHTNHISTGQAGRWRRVLKTYEVETVEELAGGWLSARGYT